MLAAGQACAGQTDLSNLSLEELANVDVTSVTRQPQALSDAAASVFVISAEDIRRSGASNLPEALRLAPNLYVAEVSANGYVVGARGFDGTSANKLLVLIDGRSVYTPLFAGVFWDVQDVMLDDIDRIEVISGPGGTLWGTNAVNGVVNIITRSSQQTQGVLVDASAGNSGSGGAVRYGGAMGANGNYRVYGKYFNLNHTEEASGQNVDDGSHQGQAGFRTDWQHGADQLSVIGNAYQGAEGQPLPGAISISGENFTLGDIRLSGSNITANWTHQLDSGSHMTLQTYYDETDRINPPTFSERLGIADIELTYFMVPVSRNAISWGAEYRADQDRVDNSVYFAFLPGQVAQQWSSLFVQDEIALRDNLKLTLGTRVERNTYTGNDELPNARLAWKLSPSELLWTALSHTVRSPSRLDRDAYAPGVPPFLLAGGPNVNSEGANVYELGYRAQPTPSISCSATLYHALYDHLVIEALAPSHTQVVFANGMTGWVTGLETWGSYQASDAWRLSVGFTGLREHLWISPDSIDLGNDALAGGKNPERTWQLRSSLDLPHEFESDLTVRHVSALSDPAVPGYYALDLGLGWHPKPGLSLQLGGENLLGGGHGEFTDITTRTEVGRTIAFRVVASLR
jgi:iron complex outermembrane receptor protein